MSRAPALCLGTVQFGLAYGIAGPGAVLAPVEARAVLAAAWEAGIRRLDTAPGYGDIEERLVGLCAGRDFSVVTKIPAIPEDLRPDEAAAFVRASLERSRSRLGDLLQGVLFHSSADLSRPHGAAAWEAASEWCAAGATPLGLSVYDPGPLAEWTRRHAVAMAQLPANALDHRLAASAAALKGIEITVRSVFLQGLLLMNEDDAVRRLPAAASALRRWHGACGEHGLTPVVAALGAIKAMPGVDFCAVGVDSTSQLAEIVAAWQAASPFDAAGLATSDAAVIDPRQWSVAA